MKCYPCETGNHDDCREPDCSCSKPHEDPPPCSHQHIVLDRFAALVGVARFTLGDGYCLDCKQPVPYKKEERP